MNRDNHSRPIRASASVCCLELLKGRGKEEPRFTLVCSLPGREGAFSKSWGRPQMLMDEHEVTDMLTWIQRTVAQAIVLDSGVQEQLKM